MILAIDPGTTESAFVLYDGHRVRDQGDLENAVMLQRLIHREFGSEPYVTVIEQIRSYGMPVGAEVLDTVFWSGRFAQAAQPFDLISRKDIKLHLCGSTRAKDMGVRQVLVDRWGGKAQAIGKKHSQGPLYGVSGHRWAALAVAVAWQDLRGE